MTPKIIYLAEKVLNMPVRLGMPGDRMPVPDGMNTPDYHVAWGAIHNALMRRKIMQDIELNNGKIGAAWGKLKNWILKKI